MKLILTALFLLGSLTATANDLKVGDPAPLFKTKNHKGIEFDLNSRKGSWTVLYFFPKAGTPGCTKQACAFRDNMTKIQALNADVFGISSDTVEKQAEFHKAESLSFTLLADPDENIIKLYGSKMPVMNMSKRWTFILDPDLIIRSINKNVDPEKDAANVVKEITKFKEGKKQ